MASKKPEAMPHLERASHHLTLAAKAFASYVAALGGHIVKGDRTETAAPPAKAPPRRVAKPKAAAPGPTSPPETLPGQEPDLWGKTG